MTVRQQGARVTSEAWYWIVSAAVAAALWAGVASSIAPALAAPFRQAIIPAASLVWIAAGALGAVEFAVARFAGPFRASPAELAWRTHDVPPALQLLQVAGVNTIIAVFGGIFLVTIAVHIGYSVATICVLSAVLIASVPLTLGAGLSVQGDNHRISTNMYAVARWSLMEADANAKGAALSLMQLDASALRHRAGVRATGNRRRLRRRAHLLSTVFWRGIGSSWKFAAALLTVFALLLAAGLPDFAWPFAALSIIWYAIRSSTVWTDWVSESRIRHGFARVPRATWSVFLGNALPAVCLAIVYLGAAYLAAVYLAGMWAVTVADPSLGLASGAWPHAVAAASPAAQPNAWPTYLWIPILTLLPAAVIAARGIAAQRSTEAESLTINTPELGPIPVGTIQRVTSGWSGGICTAAASYASPLAGAAILACWLMWLAYRYRTEQGARHPRVQKHASPL